MNNVDTYLSSIPPWQARNLLIFRKLVHQAAPDVEEDFKWNVPVFVVDSKIQFAMSAFKSHTKYNFIGNGALLDDVDGLFNNGLESKKSRGIDLKEGQTIDKDMLLSLINESLVKMSA